MGHGQYYGPRVVPCECGSGKPYWHGDPEGLRTYCCDGCWAAMNAPMVLALHKPTLPPSDLELVVLKGRDKA